MVYNLIKVLLSYKTKQKTVYNTVINSNIVISGPLIKINIQD